MNPQKHTSKLPIAVIVVILALRFLSLGAMPLVDPSESRYAVMAQVMDRSGNYLVPQLIDHNGDLTPFWGKPPLYFWLNALSYRYFGWSELTSRLPSYFAMVAAALALFFTARRCFGAAVAQNATMLLTCCGLFSVYGGLCQIDMVLTVFITGALCAYTLWQYDPANRDRWALLAAFALTGGFMTKGPVSIAVVLIAAAFPHAVRILRIALRDWRRARQYLGWPALLRFIRSKRRFPWIKVFAFVALAVAPWFVLAEQQSPGLTQYFFLHENVLRFLKHDYGDRYGSSHLHPPGTIWLYVLLSILPWCLLLLAIPKETRPSLSPRKLTRHELFLLGWGMAPAILFTLSKNLLPSYALPGVPGYALFAVSILKRRPVLAERYRALYFKMKVGFLALSVVAIIIHVAHIGSPGVDAHVLALLETNVALAAVALIVGRDMTSSDYRPAGWSLMLTAGLTLFILQTSAGIVAADQVPAATYSRYLEQRFPPDKMQLNFPFGIPYSAFLYLPHSLLSDAQRLEDAAPSESQVFIIPDKKHSKFDEAVRRGSNHYRLAADIGDWKVYERSE